MERYHATSVLSYTGGAGEAHAGHRLRRPARRLWLDFRRFIVGRAYRQRII